MNTKQAKMYLDSLENSYEKGEEVNMMIYDNKNDENIYKRIGKLAGRYLIQ